MLVQLEQAKLQSLRVQGGEQAYLKPSEATVSVGNSCCSRHARLKPGEETNDP